jgi:transposase-like protein
MGQQPYPAELREEAVALYQSGLTIPEVAKQLRIGRTTVHEWLKDHKVDIRPRGWRGNRAVVARRKQVLRLVLQGESRVDIARRLSVHLGMIGRDERGIGVPYRKGTLFPRWHAWMTGLEAADPKEVHKQATTCQCLYCGAPFPEDGSEFCSPSHASLWRNGERRAALLEWCATGIRDINRRIAETA